MRSMVHVSDPNAILAVESVALSVQVRPSTIQYLDAVMYVLTTRNLGKVDLVGNYYGTLV